MKPLRLFALCLLLLLAPAPAGAQDPVGQVQGIAEKHRRPIEATDLAEIRRPAGRFAVRAGAEVYVRDLLRLSASQEVFIAVTLHAGEHRSTITVSDRGAYEILESQIVPRRGLKLRLLEGLLLVEHLSGQLEAVVVDVSTLISGTTVLFEARGDEGFVFLQEGEIGFPDFGLTFRGRNQVWRLQRGLAPLRLSLERQEVKRWRDLARRNDLATRAQPFWQKPGFYLPAAAVLVGTGIYLATRGGDGTDRARGSVIVTLPD